MKKLFALTMFTVLAATTVVTAQKEKVKENGVGMTLLNFGAMKLGVDVKGYYFFYKIDKADKDNNNFMVNIFDNNFNDVNSFELKKPKYFLLREATYNGDYFLFSFLDGKKKTSNLITYDQTGKQIKEFVSQPMDMMTFAGAEGNTFSSFKANGNVTIDALPGTGFLKYDELKDDKTKKISYAVTLYGNDLKKIWTIKPAVGDIHKYEAFQPIYYDYKYLVGITLHKESAAGMDFRYDLVAIDVTNGKLLFQTPLNDKRYALTPTGAFYDSLNKQVVVMGEYIDNQQKLGKGRSNGIAALAFDESGKIKTEKYLTWDKDVNKFLKVDSKGKLEDGGYLGFQNIFVTSDGKIFAIAEQYKKDVSATGVAMAVLTGGRSAGAQSVVNIKIMDLMVIEFNPDFSIAKVSSFDKVDHHQELPGTLAYYPFNVVALFMKYYGLFDYNFLTHSADGKTFSVCYDIASVKSSDPVKIGNLVYTPEGTFTQSTLELKDNPNFYRIFPAKWGYLGLMEYSRKEKKITERIEKLDY